MKTRIIIFLLPVCLTCLQIKPVKSEPRRVLIEFCTGVWCGSCPCADSVISNFILVQHPQTVVLAYHGWANYSGDPMSFYRGNDILDLIGFQYYPSGIFDRQYGSPTYSWNFLDSCNSRYTQSPNTQVNLSVTAINFNPTTRVVNATISTTALQTLNGIYRINFVIT